ncbi:MAG: hypothetical protein JXA58_04710 [Dehalococcoidia bacterium]|nr:hypothetical protein [Dehalococcoidia bacterium]
MIRCVERFIFPVMLVGLFAGVSGCSPAGVPSGGDTLEWPTVQSDGSLILVSGGVGYEMADVVLIDTECVPQPGDVVQYDAQANGSDCHAFGPGQYLARIGAGPGSVVRFEECMFVAGCYLGAIECGEGVASRTQNVCWGEDFYEDVVGLSLTVPDDEYLAHAWIGQECREIGGESLACSRFTIKSDAIIGVVVKKLGHDERMQEYLESIVY